MGRHRDNYTVRHLKAMLQEDTTGAAGGTEHAIMKNSQRLGSEVLLYTEGTAPMDFSLLFPPRSDLDTSNDNYVQRSIFTVKLGRGTLMIFKDCDDQFFCHEARFDDSTLLAADPSGYSVQAVLRLPMVHICEEFPNATLVLCEERSPSPRQCVGSVEVTDVLR